MIYLLGYIISYIITYYTIRFVTRLEYKQWCTYDICFCAFVSIFIYYSMILVIVFSLPEILNKLFKDKTPPKWL